MNRWFYNREPRTRLAKRSRVSGVIFLTWSNSLR